MNQTERTRFFFQRSHNGAADSLAVRFRADIHPLDFTCLVLNSTNGPTPPDDLALSEGEQECAAAGVTSEGSREK
jgi:hypothetical protein